MIYEHSLKNKKVLLFIFAFFLVVGIFLFLYSSVIFQEGNPWPQIKGISQLNFTNKDIVKLSKPGNVYMTKSKNGQEIIKDFMKDNGYDYIEQIGSGYFFKSSAGKSVVVHKYYSHYYSLWNITENVEDKENSLTEGLRDCLPKSDTASHEKCNELLKQITDYNSCVEAGFSIMKSNPPQCATPDNRIFIQND
jgi:hypothetical protein